MEKIGCTRAAKTGSTVYLRIPAEVCQILGIEKGTLMNIYKDGDRILYDKEKQE